MSDERIDYERPYIHCEDRPVLYRADGTPLKRQIGFVMQTSGVFPALNCPKPTKKKGGKKR